MTDWWENLDDIDPSIPRWARAIARIVGPDRMTRWSDKIEAAEARAAANRCPWKSPGADAQCTRKVGHRGLCRTEYANGNVRHWYGINYPSNEPR